MFKSIKAWFLNFKGRFVAEPAKFIDTFLLILILALALGMEIVNLLGRHPSEKALTHVTLAVLSLMGIHFCFERFSVMNRMERRTAFLDLAGIKDVPKEIQCEVEDLMKYRNELRKLEKRTNRSDEQFGDIAVGILREHARQLRGLAQGTLNVPRDWKLMSYQKLMNHYQERSDAVSEDDVNYWASAGTDAAEYLEIAESAYRQHGTQLTRIFIVSLSELKLKTGNIIRILRRQEQAGIGWGVAIREEVPYEIRHRDHPLDYVLHNGRRAVSLSRQRDRRYETLFATDDPDKLLRYQQTYKDLIPFCWLVNQRYIDNYKGSLPDPDRDLNEIKKTALDRNEKLKYFTKTESDDGMFVLVVETLDDTAVKVKNLLKLANDYRRPTRRKVNAPPKPVEQPNELLREVRTGT